MKHFLYGFLVGGSLVWAVYALNLKPYLRWARDWLVAKVKSKVS